MSTLINMRKKLEPKSESKLEKTVKTLIEKKIEEQNNLNYTLLGSFKVRRVKW